MFDWVLNTPLVLTIKCHTLQSAPSEKQTFRKAVFRTLEKADIMQNSLYWSKLAVMTN